MKLAFVCTGNICRSPMAEYMLKDRMSEDEQENVTVTSAGVAASPGRPPSQPAVSVLKEIGITDIAMHSARPVRELELDHGDYLLTMTRTHLSRLPNRFRERDVRISTLKGFVGNQGSISDPFGAPVDRYREVREELDPLLDGVLEKIT